MAISAIGENGRAEFDGKTVTVVPTGILAGRPHSFPLEDLLNVEWKEGGRTAGFCHLVVPGGPPHGSNKSGAKASDNTILLRTKDQAADFRSFVTALASAIAALERPDGMMTCPRCAEDVKAAASVCRYCGAEFAPRWWVDWQSPA